MKKGPDWTLISQIPKNHIQKVDQELTHLFYIIRMFLKNN